jgi:hypothetical protein
MSKSLDQLARNLAGGMSRRKALWQFVSGLSVVGFLTARKASAYGFGDSCADYCQTQADFFKSMCMEASQSCCRGYCAEVSTLSINGGYGISSRPALGINGGGFGINGSGGICFNGSTPSGDYTCVPVYRY